jgi:hypothetical protein|tara:strand:- start:118 stop:318 length:201 start_codon:yes stop_codon:yes gene_type:complete
MEDLNMPAEEKTKIIVLDDGETYSLEGYVVTVTDKELDEIESGMKVSHVIGWDRLLAGTVDGTLFS